MLVVRGLRLQDMLQHLLFSLMHLPPPRCPLFPYTTLFRSREHGRSIDLDQQIVRQVGQKIEPENAVDRKSTRLNSSHVELSYAVFCLKKKIDQRTVPALHARSRRAAEQACSMDQVHLNEAE